MFAREHKQEYDPSSSPNIERPLATGRPLSVRKHENTYTRKGPDGIRKENLLENSKIPIYSPPRSPTKLNEMPDISKTPSKSQISPSKSSLSSKSRYAQVSTFGLENEAWSEDEDLGTDRELPPGKSLLRNAKSVTFDAAPPQINEYEMTTPDPSSVASGSREGSYESVDNEEDSFDRGASVERDDSFDESLEDTDKTPVVLPEDWRFMSPGAANDDLAARVENPFDGPESSPAPTARPSSAVDVRLSPSRTDSASSSGERRPLPPLPALAMPAVPRVRSNSASSLSATAERMSSAQRILPSAPRPASVSKSEIQGMGGCSMSLEDRLRLMMMQDEEKPKTSVEERGQKLLQRIIPSSTPSHLGESRNSTIDIYEDEVEKENVDSLDEYKLPPQISRESILRKVKSQRQLFSDDEYEYSSSATEKPYDQNPVDEIDPDTPIPSMECELQLNYPEAEVVIKQEDDGDESEVDLYSIPDLYSQQLHNESFMDSIEDHQNFEDAPSHISTHDDDDESQYSGDFKQEEQGPLSSSTFDDEGPPTPKASQPAKAERASEGAESHALLSQFSSMLEEQDFKFGLEPFLTPSPPINEEPTKSMEPNTSTHIEEPLERPITPENQLEPPRYPGQYNDSDDEPRTPDSVIRYPISNSMLPESPSVPEPIATIKAPGTKLKTRPSITPSDARAMAETRRQISGEVPMVPPIPEKHQNHPSVIPEFGSYLPEQQDELIPTDEGPELETSKQVKRKSSLIQLEVSVEKNDDTLGFGLDREFDRVMEAQKVTYLISISRFGL